MLMFWLIMAFPLLGSFLNGIVLRKAPKHVSHMIGSAALIASFICAVITYVDFLSKGGQATVINGIDWLEAGSFHAPFHYILDRLSGMMLMIITGIGSLIHIYAGGYMHEEPDTYRFFSYLNLFVFMMLQLVLGDNLVVMFIGWEGVGLCSYLLIGYWYEDDKNAAAGMKAFLVNRIGDIGFLIGIFLTFKYFHTVSFTELKAMVLAAGATLNGEQLQAVSWITLALFVGACGKSAQLPLYVWLPDAMAGPTPVSALIHAATMVTAGIYMMTRMSFFYFLAPDTQTIVASVGALTSLFAATIALVQTDIKKVLAYSTVSQLGYMVLGCGLGAYSAGVFHLLTHACFKALLFLGAGSVIVAMHHKQDMREMGGLRKYMPITHAVMLVGVLAIIGFPLFSGFFSKDEILWQAWHGGDRYHIQWALGAVAALCTAFYMVRLLMLTFYGKNRSDHHTKEHLHETSAVMWAPLIVLAVLSAGIGFLNVPHLLHGSALFEEYLEPVVQIPQQAAGYWEHLHGGEGTEAEEWMVMAFSVIGMFLASGFAIALYKDGFSPVAFGLHAKFRKAHRVLANKYYVDELYDSIFVQPLRDMSLFLFKVVDVHIVDGIVNGVGQMCQLIGGLASFRMSGSMQRHGMVLVVGLICMLTVLLF